MACILFHLQDKRSSNEFVRTEMHIFLCLTISRQVSEKDILRIQSGGKHINPVQLSIGQSK